MTTTRRKNFTRVTIFVRALHEDLRKVLHLFAEIFCALDVNDGRLVKCTDFFDTHKSKSGA